MLESIPLFMILNVTYPYAYTVLYRKTSLSIAFSCIKIIFNEIGINLLKAPKSCQHKIFKYQMPKAMNKENLNQISRTTVYIYINKA